MEKVGKVKHGNCALKRPKRHEKALRQGLYSFLCRGSWQFVSWDEERAVPNWFFPRFLLLRGCALMCFACLVYFGIFLIILSGIYRGESRCVCVFYFCLLYCHFLGCVVFVFLYRAFVLKVEGCFKAFSSIRKAHANVLRSAQPTWTNISHIYFTNQFNTLWCESYRKTHSNFEPLPHNLGKENHKEKTPLSPLGLRCASYRWALKLWHKAPPSSRCPNLRAGPGAELGSEGSS